MTASTITSTSPVTPQTPLRIGIVVGEASGDTLGVHLMHSIRQHYPNAQFEGIGGEQMLAAGFNSFYPMETLSVMGLVEVLKRIRQLFAVRDGLVSHWTANPVDVFVGIDAPDFNLRLSAKLKPLGIPCVQYVSPSVWAWRQGRVAGIAKAVNQVLCLFPFEVPFYTQHGVAAEFVGHPLANQYPLHHTPQQAKLDLKLSPNTTTIALLPGSRGGEVSRLLPVLLQAVPLILAQHPQVSFAIPASNALRAAYINQAIATLPSAISSHIQVYTNAVGEANIGRKVMAASDIVVLASGTATLEALLLARPMVVIYKLHWLTHAIVKRLIKTPFVSLPNILANRLLVPELLQHNANPQQISTQVLSLLNNPQLAQQQSNQLGNLHAQLLSANASSASKAVLGLIKRLG